MIISIRMSRKIKCSIQIDAVLLCVNAHQLGVGNFVGLKSILAIAENWVAEDLEMCVDCRAASARMSRFLRVNARLVDLGYSPESTGWSSKTDRTDSTARLSSGVSLQIQCFAHLVDAARCPKVCRDPPSTRGGYGTAFVK